MPWRPACARTRRSSSRFSCVRRTPQRSSGCGRARRRDGHARARPAGGRGGPRRRRRRPSSSSSRAPGSRSPAVAFAGGTDLFFGRLNRTKPQIEVGGRRLLVREPAGARGRAASRCQDARGPGRAGAGGEGVRGRQADPRRPGDARAPARHRPAAWSRCSGPRGRWRARKYLSGGRRRRHLLRDDRPGRSPRGRRDVSALPRARRRLLAARAGGLTCASGRPLELSALAARHGGGTTLLVADLARGSRMVELAGVVEGAAMRRLNEATADSARIEPQTFRAALEPLPASGMFKRAVRDDPHRHVMEASPVDDLEAHVHRFNEGRPLGGLQRDGPGFHGGR